MIALKTFLYFYFNLPNEKSKFQCSRTFFRHETKRPIYTSTKILFTSLSHVAIGTSLKFFCTL